MAPFSLASHARNFLTVSLHEVSGQSACERKSQKVREGGKESSPGGVSEAIGQAEPRIEHVLYIGDGALAQRGEGRAKLGGGSFHDRFSCAGLTLLVQVYILVPYLMIRCKSGEATMMKKEDSVKMLKRRYERLTARLGKPGFVLQGTITKRSIIRENPADPGKEKIYGPYYQWTRKQGGKTVTVNLTASQAKIYQKAIDNHRTMEQIIKEMRALSLKICEATTDGVKKRKAQK